ncbi:MAG: HNH endonuclease [Magnetococcales bacterium]|nr:HNH endonuclease [Magnetococcales bacterium]
MPIKAPTPCCHPGCGEVVPSPGYCDKHRKEKYHRYWEFRTKHDADSGFYCSKVWIKRRASFLRSNPLCSMCVLPTPATVVDHIVPIKNGGDRWADENLQPLCVSCHNRKTINDRDDPHIR